MKDFFLQMLNSKDPTVSSSRFLTLIVVLTVLYVWAWVCLYTRTILDVPIGVYTFTAVVVGGKTLGMFAERPSVNSQTSTEMTTKTTVGADNQEVSG